MQTPPQWEHEASFPRIPRKIKPYAIFFLALLGALPIDGSAQSPGTQYFSYCQVEDTGGRKIWVSQVFPPPPGTAFPDNTMATEFHTYVGTLGGAGNKNCLLALTPEKAAETRAKIEAIMRKKTFGISVYKWHDVNWTSSAQVATMPVGPAPQFIYCRGVDTNSRKLVTTMVFTQILPPANDAARYSVLDRFASEFKASINAQGISDQSPLCIASDTQAEAEKSRNDFRKAFAFSGVKKIDLYWSPGPAPVIAPIEPKPAVSAKTVPKNVQKAEAKPVAEDDVEADFWKRIANSTHAEDFDDYLAAFPNGRHAPIARLEAKRLRRPAGK